MAVHEYRTNPGGHWLRRAHPDAMIIRHHDTRDNMRKSAVSVFDRTDDAFGHWSAPCVCVEPTRGVLHWQYPERGGKRLNG